MTVKLISFTFIVVCIHLLRVMGEIPYGIGARVTAIIKVIVHKDVFPFYIVLIVMIISFSVGLHFAFANEIEGYRQVLPSFYNVFYAAFGDFGIGFDEMLDAQEKFAYPIIFVMLFLISLILMNIFIGVVGNVYDVTEQKCLEQFEDDLDKYMVNKLLDDLDRNIARKSLFQTFMARVEEEARDNRGIEVREVHDSIRNLDKKVDNYNILMDNYIFNKRR